jgi:hypothetical protein
MNLVCLDQENFAEIQQLPDYSQIAIRYNGLDKVPEDKKIPTINSILQKIRIEGELVISLLDYSKIIDALSKNSIEVDAGLSLLRDIKHHTEPMNIINYIISLEPKIILYKMVEDNFKTIFTLKRIQY